MASRGTGIDLRSKGAVGVATYVVLVMAALQVVAEPTSESTVAANSTQDPVWDYMESQHLQGTAWSVQANEVRSESVGLVEGIPVRRTGRSGWFSVSQGQLTIFVNDARDDDVFYGLSLYVQDESAQQLRGMSVTSPGGPSTIWMATDEPVEWLGLPVGGSDVGVHGQDDRLTVTRTGETSWTVQVRTRDWASTVVLTTDRLKQPWRRVEATVSFESAEIQQRSEILLAGSPEVPSP